MSGSSPAKTVKGNAVRRFLAFMPEGYRTIAGGAQPPGVRSRATPPRQGRGGVFSGSGASASLHHRLGSLNATGMKVEIDLNAILHPLRSAIGREYANLSGSLPQRLFPSHWI